MIVSPAQQTFRQAAASRIAVALAGGLFAALFLALGISEHATVLTAIGAGLVALTGAIIWLMSGMVLSLHTEGVRIVNRFGVKEIEYREVKEYRYRAVPSQAGHHAVGGLIGALALAAARRTMGPQSTTSFYLDLIAQDGRKLKITSAFKGAYEAIGTIVDVLHAQMRPSVEAAVRSSGAEFGPLRLNARSLQYKSKEPIPLADIVRAEVRGQMLDIKKKGKLLSSVSLRSDKVPNVLLLLETMEKIGGSAPSVFRDPQARVSF